MAGKADELIARLAAEGEFAATGGFSLDPELALQKLREHQLADPTRFVLSWIRAANSLGATRIDVEIDADDVWFRFDGEELEAREFDALWSAVVGSTARDDARVRALRELALGINGAFAWSAKWVTIQAGATKLEFDREFQVTMTVLDADSPEVIAGTQIHAKRPLAWELLRRRALDARGELPEELLLASACVRGRVPVVLEGRLLNPPLARPEGLRYELRIHEDEREGVLWLRPPPAAGASSMLHVLHGGVAVASVELSDRGGWGGGWIEAIVDDARLPLDLSQEKIVEGARYQALLACVSRARWHAYFALIALERARGQAQELAQLEAIVLRDVMSCVDLSWLDAPGAFEFANAIELPRAVSDPLGGFRTLVREPLAPPSPPRPPAAPGPLSLGEVVRFARRVGTVYRRGTSDDALPFVASIPVIRAKVSPQLAALGETTLVGLGRARYWKAVRALPPAQTWPLPDDWLQLERDSGELHVRLAWRLGIHELQAGALILSRAGRRLGEFMLPASWGPLWAWVDGPLELAVETDGELAPGPALATAVLAALALYAELLAGLDGARMTSLERALIRDYLREAWGTWSSRRLDELIVIPEPARRAAVERWSGGWGVPREWAEVRAGERSACDHELASLAWIDTGRGLASLRDAQRELASHGHLEYLTREAASLGDAAGAWRLDAGERALLADLFPGCLEPVDLAARRRERGPKGFAVPEVLRGARFVEAIAGPAGERGLLGLSEARIPASWGSPPRRGARVWLGRDGHELGFLDLPLPVGSFHGVLEVPGLRFAPHTNRAIKDDAWRAAADLVEAAARELAQAQLEAWRAGEHSPEDLRRARDWTLDLERGGWPRFAAAWREWQASLPPDHALRVATAEPTS